MGGLGFGIIFLVPFLIVAIVAGFFGARHGAGKAPIKQLYYFLIIVGVLAAYELAMRASLLAYAQWLTSPDESSVWSGYPRQRSHADLIAYGTMSAHIVLAYFLARFSAPRLKQAGRSVYWGIGMCVPLWMVQAPLALIFAVLPSRLAKAPT